MLLYEAFHTRIMCFIFKRIYLFDIFYISLSPAQTGVKSAKQMRNTKRNCFSHSFASPRNDKQCFTKQCIANQTNRYPARFASRSGL